MALSVPLAPAPLAAVPHDAALPDAPPRLWTRDEYYRMAEVGLSDSDERVELLDGELFVLPPQLTPHASSVYFTTEALRARFGMGFVVRSQLSVTRKAAAYARAGMDKYWIVNVTGRQVEAYRGPSADGTYRDVRTLGPGEDVLPLAAGPDAVPVRVDELLVPSAPPFLESER